MYVYVYVCARYRRAKLQPNADLEKGVGGGQDNVFRALMQRIKSLEMNYGIVEMYLAQISDCYRVVLNDLVAAGNASAVAMALMINTRYGAGGIKSEAELRDTPDVVYIFPENKTESADESPSSFSFIVSTESRNFFAALITVCMAFFFIFSYLMYHYLMRRILELEKALHKNNRDHED